MGRRSRTPGRTRCSARVTLVLVTASCLVLSGLSQQPQTSIDRSVSELATAAPPPAVVLATAADVPAASGAPPPADEAEGYPAFSSYPMSSPQHGLVPEPSFPPPTRDPDAEVRSSAAGRADGHAMPVQAAQPSVIDLKDPGGSSAPGPTLLGRPEPDTATPAATPLPPSTLPPGTDPVGPGDDVLASPAVSPPPSPDVPPPPAGPDAAPRPTPEPHPAHTVPHPDTYPHTLPGTDTDTDTDTGTGTDPVTDTDPGSAPGDVLSGYAEALKAALSQRPAPNDGAAWDDAAALGLWWALLETCAAAAQGDPLGCMARADGLLLHLELPPPDPAAWDQVEPSGRATGYRIGLRILGQPGPDGSEPVDLPDWAYADRAVEP
jgi:hypothetical protein